MGSGSIMTKAVIPSHRRGQVVGLTRDTCEKESQIAQQRVEKRIDGI
jgi:hypothetical protein